MGQLVRVDFRSRQVSSSPSPALPTPLTHLEKFDRVVAYLLERFEGNLPRGGVVYNSIPRADQRSFDTYGRGNVHCSMLQYRGETEQKNGTWNRPMPFPANVPAIFTWLESFPRGTELTLGVKSDAFMWMEMRYGITEMVLEKCNALGLRLTIETMSDLVAEGKYLNLIADGGHSVTMNLGFNTTEKIERVTSLGAPSIKRRILAVQKLKSVGIKVETREFALTKEAANACGFSSVKALKKSLENEGVEL